MNWAIRPPTFKNPRQLGEDVFEDVEDFAEFYLALLAHRNPGIPLLTLSGTFAGLAYYGARSAALSAPLARTAAMFAFRRAIFLSVYTAPVSVPYYIGRNISHAIDPVHGEDRFHYAIMNPIAASTETVTNLVTAMAHQRYGGHRQGGGGGF
jgi:hypothetical protein